MKPLLVMINNLEVGGAERLIVDDINELVRRGLPVRLVTIKNEKPGNSMASELRLPKEFWKTIRFRSLYDLRSLFELIRYMRQNKFQAVFTHLWFANTVGRIASCVARVPVIISFEHNVYDTLKTGKQLFLDRVLQGLSKRIVAVSNPVKTSLVRNGISEKKITVLINAISIPSYQKPKRDGLRSELGIREDETVYIFVGRLFVHQKAIDTLLSAFAQVPSGVLIMVGDGQDREAVLEQISTLGIEKRVRFLGFRSDVPDLLRISDCFVCPSRYEGLGIVVLEAMASGATVVATDFEAIHDMVTNEKDALIVPIDDVRALARAMERVGADPALRKKLSESAEYSVKKFSIEKHADALLTMASLNP